jgi:adenylylsulfate kinase
MVVWIIGLSGAGKTTLATEVVRQLRADGSAAVLVDGDVVRELFGNDLGFSIEDRRKNAIRVASLCKFLDSQGVNVVCAILSLFPDLRELNRGSFSSYLEVFINVPTSQLVQRDSKGIYARYLAGEARDVAGFDIPFPPPEKADIVIDNPSSVASLLAHAETIVNRVRP